MTAHSSCRRSWTLAAASILSASGCQAPQASTAPSPSPAPAALRTREIAVPAAPGSGEPNLVVTTDGRVLLSWIEPRNGGHSLRFASRRAGEDWSEARTIAEGRDWFVNWADFPAMAALPDGTLYAHWLQRSAAGKYTYDVHLTLSSDGGATWRPAVVPHRDGTRSEHGFVSLLPLRNDRMDVIWLDGRKNVEGHGGHGETSLMHTTVARDGALGPETLLDGRVCDCCQTSAVAADGAIVVAYRDRSAGEIRDISVVRLTGGTWSEPRTLAGDGWEIAGCPVNGPALAAAGRRVVAAWFAAPKEQARVNVAFSSDAGATFGAPIRVDQGRPLGRVDVAFLPDGDALVTWLEQSDTGAEIRLRRVRQEGPLTPSQIVASSSAARSSGFPRMESAGAEVILAWRDPSEPAHIRTALLAPTPDAR